MEDLIAALQIFLKYGNLERPTICAHDELVICGISPEKVSDADKRTLDLLGFFVSDDGESFKSFRFGSA